ncbi:MAG: hypothetical protein P4L66_14995 [Acetobacteraceae bacterium]|nr:hypothetical protein [Acetobacteraceae bacterium]
MIGDAQDMLARLKATLPKTWFPDSTPILDGLLSGMAQLWAHLYGQLCFTRLQTRLATATGGFLDAISKDFLGTLLPRRLSEPDAAFRVRIQKELVRERNTRNAVVSVLTDLTGRTPEVFEPSRPADTGGYGIGSGYGLVGGWGSLALPYQCFVTAYRAHSSGIATVAGYGGPTGGYGTGAIEYASLSMIQGQIADSDIEAAITRVMPCSAIAWTRISN